VRNSGTTTRVALALGSNLGARRNHLIEAVIRLESRVHLFGVSSLYETMPVGYSEQPHFLNAALTAETDLTPSGMLALAQSLERAAGRRRTRPNGPRTLDVDIVLFGDRVIDQPGLTVPHPRWRTRGFVWAPLNEIAPGWMDPSIGRTVAEIGLDPDFDLSGVRRLEDASWAQVVTC
jgi:2-amino-4-hydroxy-6-hydroxymethyldihydropteridine diphosphokinase